ncbi:MAG: phosphoesterase [Thermoplasmatales archaeon]|nr:phosphoesterase [Thermoplasmatales archaeon]
MRFLVVSDLHQKKSAIPGIIEAFEANGCDALLMLGDITDFGTAADACEIIHEIGKKTYAIPGNCDPLDLPELIGNCCESVHGRAFEIGRLRFAALGGSNPTIFNTPFEYPEEEIEARLRPISSEGMVLMVHAPAHGHMDRITSGANVGSTAIAKIVEEFKPLAVLSGHIHEARGFKEDDGTFFLNPGAARDGYAAVLDLSGKPEAKMLVLKGAR